MAYRLTDPMRSHQTSMLASVTTGVSAFLILEASLRVGMLDSTLTPILFWLAFSQYVIVEHFSPSSSWLVNNILLAFGYVGVASLIGVLLFGIRAFRRRPWIWSIVLWTSIEVAAWLTARLLISRGIIAAEEKRDRPRINRAG